MSTDTMVTVTKPAVSIFGSRKFKIAFFSFSFRPNASETSCGMSMVVGKPNVQLMP